MANTTSGAVTGKDKSKSKATVLTPEVIAQLSALLLKTGATPEEMISGLTKIVKQCEFSLDLVGKTRKKDGTPYRARFHGHGSFQNVAKAANGADIRVDWNALSKLDGGDA